MPTIGTLGASEASIKVMIFTDTLVRLVERLSQIEQQVKLMKKYTLEKKIFYVHNVHTGKFIQ